MTPRLVAATLGAQQSQTRSSTSISGPAIVGGVLAPRVGARYTRARSEPSAFMTSGLLPSDGLTTPPSVQRTPKPPLGHGTIETNPWNVSVRSSWGVTGADHDWPPSAEVRSMMS